MVLVDLVCVCVCLGCVFGDYREMLCVSVCVGIWMDGWIDRWMGGYSNIVT